MYDMSCGICKRTCGLWLTAYFAYQVEEVVGQDSVACMDQRLPHEANAQLTGQIHSVGLILGWEGGWNIGAQLIDEFKVLSVKDIRVVNERHRIVKDPLLQIFGNVRLDFACG